MESEWPLVTIDSIKAGIKGSIAIGPFGSRMKSDCYVEDGVPVIRGTNIAGEPTFKGNFVYITAEKAATLGSSNVYQYDLVFPHRGSIGEVGIILDDEHYVLSSSLMKLTCERERVNPKFLYYFFKSCLGRHELLKNASQVGTPGIGQPLTSLKSIEFRLPPLPIQDRIEVMLTSIDKKIELNRQTNQTLEHIVQALFKSWFVDFEQVKAKIAAKKRWLALNQTIECSSPTCYAEQFDKPKQNNTSLEEAITTAAMCAISGKAEEQLKELSEETLQQLKTTADLFPDMLVYSEFGEMPEGWELKKAIEVADVAIGKTPPRKESEWFSESPSDVRWLSIRDMGSAGVYIQTTNEHLTEDAIKKFNIRRIPTNTVLLSFKLTVGRVAISDGEMLSNEAIAHFKLNDKSNINTEYLYLYLKWFDYDNLGSTSSIATAVNSKVIKNMRILVPHQGVVDEFYKRSRPLFVEIRNLLSQTQSLISLRNTLLPKLLSGELSGLENNNMEITECLNG